MATAFYIPNSLTSGSLELSGDVKGSTGASYIPDSVATSKLLTGFVSSPGTVTSSDSILSAFCKLSAGPTNVVANSIESVGSTLNIAGASSTQTLNIGSGSGVQTINVGNGGAGSTTINLGGASDTVNIAGTLTTVNTTNTQVTDKSLVLNSGGAASSSGTSGLYFQEAADTTSSFIRISSDRAKVELKPFAGSLITLNQSLATTDNPAFGSGTFRSSNVPQLDIYPLVDNSESSIKFNANAGGTTYWSMGQNSWSVGAGNFGIGCQAGLALKIDTTKAVTIPGALAVGGLQSLGKNMYFNNNNQFKMISLWDNGTSTDQTQHNFYGLGLDTAVMRYQVGTTAADHVFYASTAATASTELLRIKGTGAVQIPGALSVTGALTVSGASVPTFESSYVHITNFTGPATLSSVSMVLTKNGRQVTLSFGGVSAATSTGGVFYLTSSTPLPARFFSSNNYNQLIMGSNNGAQTIVQVLIDSSGNITFSTFPSAAWVGTINVFGFAFTWIV